ncbi:uncharacterized protein DNG_09835 [Cephalotrichum gorgonifer]|uniref:DUF7730 domain-containing protein n=1 Tax=Cephalotrichum gorgonifer TaxID=2041049 RepID=A0AAE8SZN2_9PEZI|nr:uncharacterized protein DNG_09835 [Cephalotrichum gorgonifer]
MSKRLKKWIRKATAPKTPEAPRQSPDVYPTLPSPRPRLLTPSPSHESLVISTPLATSSSALFQRLPYEIRRAILVEAFGDRILHMDLVFDHPKVPFGRKKLAELELEKYHCGYTRYSDEDDGLFLSPFVVDKKKHKEWAWRGSVCHRRSERMFWRDGERDRLEDPCYDSCLRKTPRVSCPHWPGESPGKCFIGIMGWLLTCRQAYTEGIEVLYSTNTIHLSDPELIRRLPDLLPPQRLASIKMVEITYWFHADNPPRGQTSNKEGFDTMLRAVPVSFPNLRKIHISPCGEWFPYIRNVTYRVGWYERDMFPRIREMMLQLDQLDECVLSMGHKKMWELQPDALRRGLKFPFPGDNYWQSAWRPLSLCMGPGTATEKTAKELNSERGFWMVDGIEDDFGEPTPCFGSGWPNDWEPY